MNFEDFDSLVIAHRNSTIAFCCVMVIIGFVLMFFLNLIIKQKIIYLLFIPILAIIVYTSTVVINCNKDINGKLYEEYIGTCIYEEETVTLEECGVKFNVGIGHEFVPPGKNYGKCIYSKNSKIIVYWEQIQLQD